MLDNATYFQKLKGSVTRIARHAFYPGKDEAVELCLEEIQDLRDTGRIDHEQFATLRDVLLGDEPFGPGTGDPRATDSSGPVADRRRVAVMCQGTGSQAAFTAGVLQGLLEQGSSEIEVVALAGTSFGSLCAVLAWDGLLRGGPHQAVEQLEGFWRDYSSASVVDALLNYSAQIALQLRALVPLPVHGLQDVTALSTEQLCGLLGRRLDWHATRARSQAGGAGSTQLVIGTADANGTLDVQRGAEVDMETLKIATRVLPCPAALSRRRGCPRHRLTRSRTGPAQAE